VLAAVLVGCCMVSILGLEVLVVRSRDRLHDIRARVQQTDSLLRMGLLAEQSLLLDADTSGVGGAPLADELRRQIQELGAAGDEQAEHVIRQFAEIERLLGSDRPVTHQQLLQSLVIMKTVLQAESAAQETLWNSALADTRGELQLAIGVCFAFPLLTLLALLSTRRWLVAPLTDLGRLLSQLTSDDRQRVNAEDVHPVLVPLFASYNNLVERLEHLEAEHEAHAKNLEGEVQTATKALLEQHSALARVERLAAVGETTASLAHELRNPIAGMLMSLGNLRGDIADPELVERVDLVIAELERLTRLLNQALASAQHRPEPPRDVILRRLVLDLLALLRHQVPENVLLSCDIAEDLCCRLPLDRLRQALLNLLINSVSALDGAAGTVTVAAGRNDGKLVVSVCDDGPGFPAELLESGIRAFASQRSGGTGLGLAMVRRVAQDLGGDIQLSNREPRGACARVVVPCPDV